MTFLSQGSREISISNIMENYQEKRIFQSLKYKNIRQSDSPCEAEW